MISINYKSLKYIFKKIDIVFNVQKIDCDDVWDLSSYRDSSQPIPNINATKKYKVKA